MANGSILLDILAARYAQDSLDLLNQSGPWPSDGMVSESERLSFPYPELVKVGYSLLSKQVKS